MYRQTLPIIIVYVSHTYHLVFSSRNRLPQRQHRLKLRLQIYPLDCCRKCWFVEIEKDSIELDFLKLDVFNYGDEIFYKNIHIPTIVPVLSLDRPIIENK